MTDNAPNLGTGVSRHLSVWINRPAGQVYDYVRDPTHLPDWAAGLGGGSITRVDGQWVADSPAGPVTIAFAPRNDHGVLDHDVTLPSGDVVHVPLRVLADGDGCEVVFTLRREPGMTDEAFARDADAVVADLAALKHVVEATRPTAPVAGRGPRSS